MCPEYIPPLLKETARTGASRGPEHIHSNKSHLQVSVLRVTRFPKAVLEAGTSMWANRVQIRPDQQGDHCILLVQEQTLLRVLTALLRDPLVQDS